MSFTNVFNYEYNIAMACLCRYQNRHWYQGILSHHADIKPTSEGHFIMEFYAAFCIKYQYFFTIRIMGEVFHPSLLLNAIEGSQIISKSTWTPAPGQGKLVAPQSTTCSKSQGVWGYQAGLVNMIGVVAIQWRSTWNCSPLKWHVIVMHVCINNLTVIGSDNGLSPARHQDIIWIKAGILLTQTLGINYSEILKWNTCIVIQENAFENVVFEMVKILYQPQSVTIAASVNYILV